jgi:hypothetical protein
MLITPVVTQANGIIQMRIQATFVGDSTDANDKKLIAALGDPQVNIAGNFVDPNDSTFTFVFPTTQNYVGITTQLSSQTAQFMEALPQLDNPNMPAPIQGAMDCVTANPGQAATAWFSVMVTRIQTAVLAPNGLRGQSLVGTLSPATV